MTAPATPKVIAVMMYKGGSGKTTTALNVAASAALEGKRTLLIDLDWQCNATSGAGFELGELPGSINDLFADPARDPRGVIQATDYGLHVLPGSGLLANSAMNMSPEHIYLVRNIIDQLRDDYDVVVIDTPPQKGYMTINAMAAATDVLVPVAAKAYAEEGLAAIVLSIAQAQYNPDLRLAGLIFTNVEANTVIAQRVMQTVATDYPEDVLPFAIPKATFIDQGNDMGLPGVLVDPQHPAAVLYKELTRRLLRDAK